MKYTEGCYQQLKEQQGACQGRVNEAGRAPRLEPQLHQAAVRGHSSGQAVQACCARRASSALTQAAPPM